MPGVPKQRPLESHRQARSLSYGSMDEAQFRGVFEAMCRYVSETYWPDCEPEQIEEMAEMMGVAA